MKKNNNKKYEISIEDLTAAKDSVIPVAISSRETINELEDWVKGRALYSNKTMAKKAISADDLDDMEIDFDDII
jgi:hypothetical protein